jgi:hypothetical protein
MARIPSLVGALVAGAAAAVLVSSMARTANKATVAPSSSASAPAPIEVREVSPADDRRLSALEGRLRQLETSAAAGARPANSVARPETRSANFSELPGIEKKWDEEIHAKYNEEGSDPKWGTQAAHAIQAKLLDKASHGTFAIGDVNCKTTMCQANVSWPTYAAARKEYRRLVPLAGIPCATHISVPEPEHPEQAYAATMVLDCEDWRAGAQ